MIGKEKTDNSQLLHVAVIMDGNGRWATARRLPRQAGHRAGIDSVRRVVRAADELGIGVLTLYSFSSENWRRPALEVNYLMDLLRFFFRREISDLHANGVRVCFLGEREGLAEDILGLMAESESKTAGNAGLRLNVAFNYGSQRELTLAAARALQVAKNDPAKRPVTEAMISENLFDPGMPPPDMVIRTGGDQRLSNFLLWQAARAELYYDAKFWPDFGAEELKTAVNWLKQRQIAA